MLIVTSSLKFFFAYFYSAWQQRKDLLQNYLICCDIILNKWCTVDEYLYLFSTRIHIRQEATTIQKIFEKNSSSYVKQCTMGKVYFLFFRGFLLVLTQFSFLFFFSCVGTEAPPAAKSRSAICEATCIYQFITNNHASFYLW